MKKRKADEAEDAPREPVKRPKIVRAQRKFAQGVNVPIVKTQEPPRVEQQKEEKEKNEIHHLPSMPIGQYLNMVTFGNIIYKNPYTSIDCLAPKPLQDPEPKKLISSLERSAPVQDIATASGSRIELEERRQTENTKAKLVSPLQPVVRVLRKHGGLLQKNIENRLTRQSLSKCPSIDLNKNVAQSKKLTPKVVLKALSRKDNPPVKKQIVSSPKVIPLDFSSEDEIPLKRTRNAVMSREKPYIRPPRKTKNKANVKSLSRNLRSGQIEDSAVSIPEKIVFKKSTHVLASDVKTRSKSGLLPKKSFTDSDEEPLALKISDLENSVTKKQPTAKRKALEEQKTSTVGNCKITKLIPKSSKSKLNGTKVVKTPLKRLDRLKVIETKTSTITRPLRTQRKALNTKVSVATFRSATLTDSKNRIPIGNSNVTHTKVLKKNLSSATDKLSSEKPTVIENTLLGQHSKVTENVEKWLVNQPMPLQEISEPHTSNYSDAVFKRPLVPPSNKTTNANKRQNIPVTEAGRNVSPESNSDPNLELSLKWSDIVCASDNSNINADEFVDTDSVSEYASSAQTRCKTCSSCKNLLNAVRRLERLFGINEKSMNRENNLGESSCRNNDKTNLNQTEVNTEMHKHNTTTNINESENAIDMNPPNEQNTFQRDASCPEPNVLPNNITIQSRNCQDTIENQGSEDHLFYLRFPNELMRSGINLDDHLIQAVNVKLPHKRSIVRAKLVNKSDVNSISPLQSSFTSNIASVNILPNTLPLNGSQEESLSNSSILTVNLNEDLNFKSIESNSNQESSVESLEKIPSASISTLGANHLFRRDVKQTLQDINPINKLIFPQATGPAQMVEAPIFRPSEKEFQDPLQFIESITPIAARYGICKIIPPKSFMPECRVSDDVRFKVHNQYLHRMLHRWGPSAREMCAIKKYLATQGVRFANPPLVGGIELDLPKLYQTVQNLGGLNEVIEKKKWPKVVDELKIPKSKTIFARLANIYLKFLLPYDTLSQAERQNIFQDVERQWLKKEGKMLSHAGNPLNNTYLNDQKVQGEESAPASNRIEASPVDLANYREMEDCIIAGKTTTLGTFHKTAKNAMFMHFSKGNNIPKPSPAEVESSFWNHVTSREEHVCVNAASIDSGTSGYGFPNTKTKYSPISKHPWNLKVLTNNSGSVLRSLGGLIGVTVPTIHVGMVFSTCCWYRDPHGLSWIEYLHKGAPKIWYSVPDGQSEKFRHAMEKVVPSFCLNKKIWLPSDMTMVPPTLLIEQGVTLGQTVQQPGEFVVVFPRAYTSSISTGYFVSESVYFAPPRWLQTVDETFKDLQDSCEPTIFSLESLLISMANDSRWSDSVITEVYAKLAKILEEETKNRSILLKMGIKVEDMSKSRNKKQRNLENMDECDICRKMLCLSMVTNWFADNPDSFCLHHAIYLYNKQKPCSPQTTIVYTWTIVELEEILTKMRRRLLKL